MFGSAFLIREKLAHRLGIARPTPGGRTPVGLPMGLQLGLHRARPEISRPSAANLSKDQA